jgi:hypothetical protein
MFRLSPMPLGLPRFSLPAGKDNYWEGRNDLFIHGLREEEHFYKNPPLNDPPPVPVTLSETPKILH